MASIIAMRGDGFKPHIVKAIVDSDNTVTSISIEKWKMKSIEKKHYERVIKAMQMVIRGPYKHNTGWRFGKTKYTIAGKTGTAELYHRYNDNNKTVPRRLRDHALFIGFAPVKKPKIAIALLIEHEPSAVGVARKIFDAYFSTKQQL
jgi:penicillin-binding protein 2